MSLPENEFKKGWKHWLNRNESEAKECFIRSLEVADGSLKSKAFDSAAFMLMRETSDPKHVHRRDD